MQIHRFCTAGVTRMVKRRRSGVSLLEVTFAIGVVMVGLLGIAALLPVAGILANKGAVTDAATRLGTSAVREFHIRGMADPRNWRWFDEGPPAGFRAVTPVDLAAGNSFCVDPRFIGMGAVAPLDHADRNRFPFAAEYDAGVLSMPRITLATSPGGGAMVLLQADEIFHGRDNLLFDLPSDRTIGPVQQFVMSGPNFEKRQVKDEDTGRTSWMATVVPKLDRGGVVTDEYTLSIVVFSRRVIDRTVTALGSERAVLVVNFYSGTPVVGGGDMQLVTRPNRPPDDVELRSGDWVMLSGMKSTLGGPIQVHKWYRVVSVDEEPLWDSANSVWLRDVTLVGPDWDAGNLLPFVPPFTTQVTIVRDVVAVFEKTIRLENSSLWTN